MPNRRQIREAVVQFLYCSDLEGGANPVALREPFWQFVTESDRRSLVLATWKTIQHLSRTRETRLNELTSRIPEARAVIAARPDLESMVTHLDRIADLESQWQALYTKLSRIRRDSEDDSLADQFSDGFEKLFSIDRDLSTARREVVQLLEDHPELRPQLEPVTGSLNRLERITQRLLMIEHPEDFPDDAEFAKIRSSRAELQALREQSDEMVDAVLAHKTDIDERLESLIENFAPERIDPVDRAILRLGAWEILHQPDVPHAVAINEAVELAKKFGTSDSGRFVNGILDRLAKA